ncbi:MAG: hypothetical protein HFJ27_02730 [Clostridia bacterium]|nr:hypothetical protein [Clostridia bacterium]
MKEAILYENSLYRCDIRSAENLEKIYAARCDWINGIYYNDKLLSKEEIFNLLNNHLIAVEGLAEINEEDLKKLKSE